MGGGRGRGHFFHVVILFAQGSALFCVRNKRHILARPSQCWMKSMQAVVLQEGDFVFTSLMNVVFTVWEIQHHFTKMERAPPKLLATKKIDKYIIWGKLKKAQQTRGLSWSCQQTLLKMWTRSTSTQASLSWHHRQSASYKSSLNNITVSGWVSKWQG